MRLQPDGDIEVSLGETVTMEITATKTAFLAHTGAISHGQWLKVQCLSPSKEIRHFKVTNKFSANFSYTTGFDFSTDRGGKISANAKYKVKIWGDGPGGYERKRTIGPTSILPTSRVFAYEVGQG
jgi:hypothetical protein